MIYNPLGNTRKEVSAISFGAMRFNPSDYKKDPQICADILLRAHELGVNYFDTAPGYCEDYSEDIVGLAMRQIRGKRPYVGTKCALWMATTEKEAYECVKKSRDRLGVDTIDFYYMWCVKDRDDYRRIVAPGGIYDGLLRAKQDGLIEHILCSAHMEGSDYDEIIQDGKAEALLLGYNALNFTYRQEALKACHDAGLGVIVMNPLGGGIIPRAADQFAFLRSSPDESIVHAALRFVLAHEAVSVALPGPSSIAELEECVAALDHISPLTPERYDYIAKHLQSDASTLCTSCGYCDECPEGVPIVKLMDNYNRYMLGETLERSIFLLNGHWNLTPADAAKCTQCGVCEPLCTQKLPIMKRLKDIAGWSSP